MIPDRLRKSLGGKLNKSQTKNLVSFSAHMIKVLGETSLEVKKVVFELVTENVDPVVGQEVCEMR